MSVLFLFLGGVVAGVILALSILNHSQLYSIFNSSHVVLPADYDVNITKQPSAIKNPDNIATTATIERSSPLIENNLKLSVGTSISPAVLSSIPKKKPKIARPRWTPGDIIAVSTRKDVIDVVKEVEIAPTTSREDNSDLSKAIISKPGRGRNKKKYVAAGGRTKKNLAKEYQAQDSLINKNRSARMIILPHQVPSIPYHQQAHMDLQTFIPNIPTYEQIKKLNKSLPNMERQKGDFEKENLKLHFCNAVFEAYSASYLTTKQHMLSVASEGYNLTWVNCEMASFIHMKESNRFYKNPQSDGLIMQSLDLLDFSVIHLSAYERSTHKHRDVLFKTQKEMKANWHNIDPVIAAGKYLEWLNNPFHSTPRVGKSPISDSVPRGRTKKINYSKEALRTVVVMPFLGGAMGAGHSKLGNRFEYLKTCFWSIYEFLPNIVAGVTRQEDVDWGMKESGLPFYDLILISGLPKSAGLPVATTQHTKQRLLDGRWDFDYVFFTESDQILISRELPLMYAHLKKFPGHMILPHRLMPYSDRVMQEAHDRLVTGPLSNVVENQW
eukprot:CAMPEP_0170065456 /NCGR_PEP_ID=MMETSP0019_2-20121128/5536_1 /TAXON_ID=98059 /ORGANISM="Dinobryon sp., Strain UTEXLB2267" /LENGTH=553 /DNA_ID=CAMNT_0010272329 /DNA_START=11 /DNA_END=1669 /DNA_ORIENTATION=+